MGISVTKQNDLKYPFSNPEEELEDSVEKEEELEELEDDEEEIFSKDEMSERGFFEANGYIFMVKPITFFETLEITSKGIYVPSRYDRFGDEVTDKELGRALSTIFKKQEVTEQEKLPFYKRIAKWFKDKFRPKDYVDYSLYPSAKDTIELIESKVSYKGKKVKFYELETKFNLSKGEIANLLIYLLEFSGF